MRSQLYKVERHRLPPASGMPLSVLDVLYEALLQIGNIQWVTRGLESMVFGIERRLEWIIWGIERRLEWIICQIERRQKDAEVIRDLVQQVECLHRDVESCCARIGALEGQLYLGAKCGGDQCIQVGPDTSPSLRHLETRE